MPDTASSLNIKADRPDLVKRIGKTTCIVKIHFSEKRRKTMNDKIKHLLRSGASQMQLHFEPDEKILDKTSPEKNSLTNVSLFPKANSTGRYLSSEGCL